MRHIPKRDLKLKTFEDRIMRMPLLDRMTLLIGSVIENERNAAVNGLIQLVSRMAMHYNIEARMEFGELLRNVADVLDRDDIDEARWLTMTEKTR